MAGSENKRWPIFRTYTDAPARQMTFQLWDGYGDKLDGAGLTFYLKAKLGETVEFDDLLMEAVQEEGGLYRAFYTFTKPGDYDAQIKVVNGVLDKDYCEPITIRVKEPI